MRSPYGPGTLELIANIYTLFGFAVVRQDWRGTGLSGGHFGMFHGASCFAPYPFSEVLPSTNLTISHSVFRMRQARLRMATT